MMEDDYKLITCIVPVGTSKAVMVALHEKFALLQMQFNFARGIGKRSHLATQGWDEHAEKEILTVTVKAEQADEVFEFLFYETKMDQPHHGVIYMHAVQQTTAYCLPKGLSLEQC